MRFRSQFLTFLALLCTSACAGLSDLDRNQSRIAAPATALVFTGPALTAVSTKKEDTAAELVNDTSLGGLIKLTISKEYDAASGKRCKEVIIQNIEDNYTETRVACAAVSGWYWTRASLPKQ